MTGSDVPRLGATDVAVLESLYQHRLLSTRQLHELHTPESRLRRMQKVVARLRTVGLAATTRLPGGLGLWYLTPRGAEAVEVIPTRAETRRKVIRPEQAAGPLQQHSLNVNDVGIAFVRAARERSHDCGVWSWRHEIAHSLGRTPNGRAHERVIADALLTYQLGASFHYRLIELDRSTMPVDDLAAKLARYARLYRHTIDGGDGDPVPSWSHYYPVFPGVLVVLGGDVSASRCERRRKTLGALCRSDEGLRETPEVELSIGLLSELIEQGPFAPIFHSLSGGSVALTNWLGDAD